MGHYRSEMVSQSELDREARIKKENLERKVKNFEELIATYGLSEAIVRYVEKENFIW